MALDINVWSKQTEESDALLQQSLAVVLAWFADKSVVTLLGSENPALLTRLLKPVLRLGAIRRSAENIDNELFIRCVAHLQVYGELELHLSLGESEPQGLIESIDYNIDSGLKD